MSTTTFKRPFVTAAVVAGLLIAAAPASAGSHQAATDGTSNTLINSVVGDSHPGQALSGFSWSETQTGSAKTAGVYSGGPDTSGFVVDGPFTVKPASGFSWSETQTGSAKIVDAAGFVVDGPFSVKPASGFSWSETQTGSVNSAGGRTATRTGTQSP